jgi:phenylpropionate dioxygenase-like ring-hydroxylating dioxygenase large terminal subunit
MNNRGKASSPDEARNYPLNCWYVAATSDEVGRKLLGRRLLGEDVLLYRQESGTVVALEDRCLHRSMPLSLGYLVGDQVVCGYHGFTYAPSGECVRVPSQTHVPYGACLRAFPVREEAPFVWIWPGDLTRAQASPLPSLPWLREEGWATFGGVLHVQANYLLLHDNALDLTHFPFVHGELSTLGYRQLPPPLQVEVTELSVSYHRIFPPVGLADWQVRATGLSPDQEYEQRESGTFVSPGLHIDHMDIVVPAVDGKSSQVYEKVYIRAFTPEGPTSTYVFWQVARNFATEDVAVTEDLRTVHEQMQLEDKPVLEAIQARERAGKHHADLSVNADIASLKAHQIVETMLGRERGSTAIRPSFRRSRLRI